MTTIPTSPQPRSLNPWYRPTFSPEHGAYVVLLVSFLTGAAAAQQWTGATTLALLCVYSGFQAEHPLKLQIKQRSSWKPRWLVWLGLYGGVAGAIALWLVWQSLTPWPLFVILGLAIAATLVDGYAVWQRQQRSIANEFVAFTAICLAAPLAYWATTGTLSSLAIALWLMNTLFFSSAIFTVKLRKVRTSSLWPGLVFHCVATGLVLLLWQVHWLTFFTIAAFGVVMLKFGLICWQKDWYCQTKIQNVALLETTTSLVFLAIAALSLLPPTLN
ncbi:MAG: YwiC-like family protein [Cyanobacteria bacterium P01_G01_bin.54]